MTVILKRIYYTGMKIVQNRVNAKYRQLLVFISLTV
jgi:hypothetical protein